MIRLKNVSDALEPRSGGSTINTHLTKHPLTQPREWTKEPIDETTGEVSKKQLRGLPPDKRSKDYHIVIAPGQTVVFGEDEDFNEEQAEYLYLLYGHREDAPERPRVRNWLLEVDEEGQEIKADQSLWYTHRKFELPY